MAGNKKILAFEISGMVFIIVLGSLLHFTYEMSGGSPIVGIFSAINESVWEHMKLAFWPSLFWVIIEFLPLKKVGNNFFTAKALGTYLMVFMIPLIFYSYTSFTGESIFAIDIASFIVAIIVGQILSYKLLTFRLLPRIGEGIAILLLILLGASFVIFTFYPPQLPIFQAPSEG
ncbi:TPA: hypothetical protein HA273_01455 [Candidatus Bathyarchaeota archaeon]|nr:hypothetical protein [Candidatus Bathyarchaeota archaeon]HIJ08911.1 hypothetical protein [Candidatus Bathyarchaeota archaeon]